MHKQIDFYALWPKNNAYIIPSETIPQIIASNISHFDNKEGCPDIKKRIFTHCDTLNRISKADKRIFGIGNWAFYEVLSEVLWLQIATNEEVERILGAFPWNNELEKIMIAGIPFTGFALYNTCSFSVNRNDPLLFHWHRVGSCTYIYCGNKKTNMFLQRNEFKQIWQKIQNTQQKACFLVRDAKSNMPQWWGEVAMTHIFSTQISQSSFASVIFIRRWKRV